MERYDFRDCAEERDEKEETIARKRKQFKTVILPILITFAENTSALLEVDQRDDGIVRATLRNRHGFEITENERLIKIVLLSAVLMTMEADSGESVIRLVFDCHVFGV